ncbi:peroxiredoxin [Sphingobium amiense]|uniref:Peroxiredoxin n=1 Tax=Sphingobium amiense TaxID=135719 RepID=A0A494W9U1_9SPHN|nr:DsrE family protein [Sphingobium amiense]BBE00107.1 peroxiredoxin [Sphingobium amiense]
MRPLILIAATDDAERLRAALTLAAAQAALGGAATVFLQLDAVALLRQPVEGPRDAAHRAAGLPDLATLIDEARALGVRLIACQSGLALARMEVGDLPSGVTTGGPVELLRDMSDDARLSFV